MTHAFLFSVIVSLCSLAPMLNAVIIETPNLVPLENEIENLDEETLVVFDVDLTLIVPQDLVLRGRDKFWPLAKQKTSKLQDGGERCLSLLLLQSKSQLIDPKVLDLIEALKKKNVPVMALTAIPSGKFGLIPNVEDWRIQQLASLGLHFGSTAPYAEEIHFTEFQGKGNPPIFKQGVIASGRYPKGKVLASFLRKIDWQPKRVIFIDDLINFVKSVETEMDKLGIDHTSYLYTAADELPSEFNEEFAHFRLDYLIEHDIWLSDEEAQKILEERCLTSQGT